HLVVIRDHVDRLLPTIRSRCRLLRVPPAAVTVARDWLAAQGVAVTGLDDNVLRMPLPLLAADKTAIAELEGERQQALCKLMVGRVDAVVLAEHWAEQPAEQLADWLYRTACTLLEYRLTGGGLQDDALARC